MYTLRELEVLVAGGESEVLELKASTAEMDRAARTVAGMANQGGGLVLVGVRPDGAIVGQETSERTLEKIATQLARISPRPIFSVTTTPVVSDRSVVVIRVDAGPLRPYRCNGTAYMRAGASTLELSEEQARKVLLDAEHQGQRWEGLASSLSIDELDTAEVRQTVEDAVRLGPINDPSSDKPIDLLRGLGVLGEGDRPTNAAAVLFGTSDALGQHGMYQCQLKTARFLGAKNTAPMADEHQWIGNVFDLYRRADRFLVDHLRIAAVLPKDAWIRVDTPEIPPNALREAVLNALAHRDYSMWSASISIAYFDDRIDIGSPGGLHFGLTPERLYEPHRSQPWNPQVARVLHQRGFIETWGTGLNKMVDEIRDANLVVPLLSEVTNHLIVSFTKPGWSPHAYRDGLDVNEIEVLDAVFAHGGMSIAEAEQRSGKPRRSLQRTFRALADRGLVELSGRTHGARWVPILDPFGANWRKH
jgi:ATP-dependent DNA helicase RecG